LVCTFYAFQLNITIWVLGNIVTYYVKLLTKIIVIYNNDTDLFMQKNCKIIKKSNRIFLNKSSNSPIKIMNDYICVQILDTGYYLPSKLYSICALANARYIIEHYVTE
jgi:hypothetical protein